MPDREARADSRAPSWLAKRVFYVLQQLRPLPDAPESSNPILCVLKLAPQVLDSKVPDRFADLEIAVPGAALRALHACAMGLSVGPRFYRDPLCGPLANEAQRTVPFSVMERQPAACKTSVRAQRRCPAEFKGPGPLSQCVADLACLHGCLTLQHLVLEAVR